MTVRADIDGVNASEDDRTGIDAAAHELELTILMPCLNEAETLGACVDEARDFLARHRVSGEVLIADNGSTDGSADVARAHGARVTGVPAKGYGAALIHGIREARGRYVIMGDSDGSYDFAHLEPFLERLRSGCDLVIGNRFRGGIERGAMPFLHKYLGNPVLSYLGRLFFAIPVGDFHCGLRGFARDRLLALGLRSRGMEFASEMLVRAALAGMSIAEVPTTLPLVHWLPKPLFRRAMRSVGLGFFADEASLNLMSRRELRRAADAIPAFRFDVSSVELLGWPSNLLLVGHRKR